MNVANMTCMFGGVWYIIVHCPFKFLDIFFNPLQEYYQFLWYLGPQICCPGYGIHLAHIY